MHVWRISKHKHAANAWTGEGARRFGGRWNSKGTLMVYCASSLSLAALETFVHMELQDAGNLLVAIPALIPTTLKTEEVNLNPLPPKWRNYPAPNALLQTGDDWIQSSQSAVLIVPSIVIPTENNILLNPHHLDFSQIQIGQPQPFVFDPRMWK